jgi:hypothetical protein
MVCFNLQDSSGSAKFCQLSFSFETIGAALAGAVATDVTQILETVAVLAIATKITLNIFFNSIPPRSLSEMVRCALD